MKYLGLLFIFLLAFTVVVTYVVIGEGEIFNIIDITGGDNRLTEDMIDDNADEIAVLPYDELDGEINFEIQKIQEIKTDISGESNILNISAVEVYDIESKTVFHEELDEYLCGVVFAEMPASFEIEALKAQAVAARSFCIYKMLNPSESDAAAHHGADVCSDSSHCKAYISYDNACAERGEDYISPLWEKVRQAVIDTSGEIVAYDSEPAIAVFHAMSNKSTESAENIWGGNVPYLVSVPTLEGENSQEIKNFMTTSVFDAEEFKAVLLTNGFRAEFSEPPALWISDAEFNSSGRIDTLKICGKVITGKRLREIFSLRSTDFDLKYNDIDGCFVFSVRGYGHGVGMSQYGANLMAKNGEDYESILLWYYKGVEVVNIYDMYDADNGGDEKGIAGIIDESWQQ